MLTQLSELNSTSELYHPIEKRKDCGYVGENRPSLPLPVALPVSHELNRSVSPLSFKQPAPKPENKEGNSSLKDLRHQIMEEACDTDRWLAFVDQYVHNLESAPYVEVQNQWHKLAAILITRIAKEQNMQLSQRLCKVAQNIFQKETTGLDTDRRVVQLVNKLQEIKSQLSIKKPADKEKLLGHCIRLVQTSTCPTDWTEAQKIFDRALQWRLTKNSPDPFDSILLIARKVHEKDPEAAFSIVADLTRRCSAPRDKEALVTYHLSVVNKDDPLGAERSFRALSQLLAPDQLDTNQRLAIVKKWNETFLKIAPCHKTFEEFLLSLCRVSRCRNSIFWTQRWQTIGLFGNAQEAIKAWGEFLSLTGNETLCGSEFEREECFDAALKALALCESRSLECLLYNSNQQTAFRNLAPESLKSAYSSFLFDIGVAGCKAKKSLLPPTLGLLSTISLSCEQSLSLAEVLMTAPEAAHRQRGLTVSVNAVASLEKDAEPEKVEQIFSRVTSLLAKAKDSYVPEVLMNKFVDAVNQSTLPDNKKLDIAHEFCLSLHPHLIRAAASLLSSSIDVSLTANHSKIEQILSHIAPLAVRYPTEILAGFRKVALYSTIQTPPLNVLLEAYLNPLLALVHAAPEKQTQVKAFSAFAAALSVISKHHDLVSLTLSPSVPDTLVCLAKGHDNKCLTDFFTNSLQSYFDAILSPELEPAANIRGGSFVHIHEFSAPLLLPIAQAFLNESLVPDRRYHLHFLSIAQYTLLKIGLFQEGCNADELRQARTLFNTVINQLLKELKTAPKTSGQPYCLQLVHSLLAIWKNQVDPLVIQIIESGWSDSDSPRSFNEELIIKLLKRDLDDEAKRTDALGLFLNLISQLVKNKEFDAIERCVSVCTSHVKNMTKWNCEMVNQLSDELVACYDKHPQEIGTDRFRSHITRIQTLLYGCMSKALNQEEFSIDAFETAANFMAQLNKYGVNPSKECWSNLLDPLVAQIPRLCHSRTFLFPMIKFVDAINLYVLLGLKEKSNDMGPIPRVSARIRRVAGLNARLAAEAVYSRSILFAKTFAQSKLPPSSSSQNLWNDFAASMQETAQPDLSILREEIGWISDAIVVNVMANNEMIKSCITLWINRAAEFLNRQKDSQSVVKDAIHLHHALQFLLVSAGNKCGLNPSKIASQWLKLLSKGNNAVKAEAASWTQMMQENGWNSQHKKR